MEKFDLAINGGTVVLPIAIDPHVHFRMHQGQMVILSRHLLHSRCDYTPYEGRYLRGYPVASVSRGEIVIRDGEFSGRAGRGRLVERGQQPAQSLTPAVSA